MYKAITVSTYKWNWINMRYGILNLDVEYVFSRLEKAYTLETRLIIMSCHTANSNGNFSYQSWGKIWFNSPSKWKYTFMSRHTSKGGGGGGMRRRLREHNTHMKQRDISGNIWIWFWQSNHLTLTVLGYFEHLSVILEGETRGLQRFSSLSPFRHRWRQITIIIISQYMHYCLHCALGKMKVQPIYF